MSLIVATRNRFLILLRMLVQTPWVYAKRNEQAWDCHMGAIPTIMAQPAIDQDTSYQKLFLSRFSVVWDC